MIRSSCPSRCGLPGGRRAPWIRPVGCTALVGESSGVRGRSRARRPATRVGRCEAGPVRRRIRTRLGHVKREPTATAPSLTSGPPDSWPAAPRRRPVLRPHPKPDRQPALAAPPFSPRSILPDNGPRRIIRRQSPLARDMSATLGLGPMAPSGGWRRPILWSSHTHWQSRLSAMCPGR
jgi:hypothetical protein